MSDKTEEKVNALPPKKNWAELLDEDEEEERILQEKLKNISVPDDKNAESKDQEETSAQKKELVEKKGAKLVVEQADPNSPLHSVKSFEELNLSPELLKGIYEMGFNKPSKIQESALPIITANPPQNLIAQAQSGTGKTAAFTLGMLYRCDVKAKEPQAICVAPTRELARQLYDNIRTMGKYTGLEVQLFVKDELSSGKVTAQVIVGTPGPFLDLITKKRSINPKSLKVFVLDEADVLFAMTGQLSEQSVRLKKLMNPKIQTLLFSATFQPQVRQFASRIVPEPCANIALKKKNLTIDAIQQLYINCGSNDGKFKVLSDIFNFLTVGQTIIFVHTRKTAVELTDKLKKEGHTVSYICGGQEMTPQDRDVVIDQFRDAKIKVLIATNVLARGIDISQVMLVINYDLPMDQEGKVDTETYLHRIGRSGRFGRKGIAINFVDGSRSLGMIKDMERFFQRDIKEFQANQIENLQPMLEALHEMEALNPSSGLHGEEDDD
eukprot:TRINITY_DN7745_c0_g1_i1.p1 TRINITY_DN7745_c0_g1~~TRINITY_DN7745_c0_g1_i1.p1  ORF type:complete len:504 (-),score=187.27 TRINITY_DN7745_c0_g1_i1:154-1638(-)